MADSKLVRQCDGSDYNEFKDDLVQLQVLSDAEYVLQHPCPEPITATVEEGIWGDAEHPCADDDERKGTAAPRETVSQRAQSAADRTTQEG